VIRLLIARVRKTTNELSLKRILGLLLFGVKDEVKVLPDFGLV